MDGPRLGERQLVPVWSYRLIALSYFISWLGAYTSTQIVIHAKYSRSRPIRWLWTFLASVAFGFTAIWSMHFVGMLACGLDVRITFDIGLTILSALVAVVFTFIAFATGYASSDLEHSTHRGTNPFGFSKSWTNALHALRRRVDTRDPEAANHIDDSTPEERRPILASTSDHGDNEEDDDDAARFEHDDALRGDFQGSHPRVSTDSNDMGFDTPDSSERLTHPSRRDTGRNLRGPSTSNSTGGLSNDGRRPRSESHSGYGSYFYAADTPAHPWRDTANVHRRTHDRLSSPRPQQLQSGGPSAQDAPSSRTSSESTPLTTDSSEDSVTAERRLSSTSSQDTSGTTLSSSLSWSEPLHAGLSREARLRIKAQARDKPVPTFGWKYWMKTYYKSVTIFVAMRAAVWGAAIVFMHYCGMWAMEIPKGRIEFEWSKVILSYMVAYTVSFIGCIAMVHMEVHFGRQVAFSTIAAFGCCSMHYTGMWAATFYTRALPAKDPGYPSFLSFSVLVIAVFVCVISNTVLAHSAILSRNRMAEVILTKRRIWRIMAEKEAAEQANELKQQFISVASHEIRTPLHAVNGYCELLALTDLTDEQKLYVTSIQQACHAINVIAGNVLDFSKLDRNNVELSARPVLVDLRKMVEDQARIIETKGAVHPQPAVDIIVSVADNVPQAMYLDDTYTFRILMNLLSNAQKFCEEGYVCVTVTMDSDTLVAIQISDTGCGIPKSFRNALFQPFRQADSSFTRPKQGTGLGLSIVKHLVQRMSGTVDVESVEGEGSVFTVKLPITVSTSTPPRATPPPVVTKRVKVVYRHERTAKMYTALWTRHGMIASQASVDTPIDELLKDADAIWTDVESIRRSRALKDIMTADAETKTPPLFIVHADAQELSVLEPRLSGARSVILVKRPVIMHDVVTMVINPEPYMGAHVNQTRVRFALPQATPLQTPMEEREEPFTSEPTGAPADDIAEDGETILLVEDNVVNQHLGKRVLEKLGYHVVTANNGQEAIDKVTHSRFFCVFMDCQMPVMDGFAATTKIRELESNGTINGRITIVALTANVSMESEEKCKAAGMDHFLPKPFKMADLQTLLVQMKDRTSP